MPILNDLTLDLYDLEYRGGVVRITIDTPVGSASGVNLENIALVTRLLSRELDHHDPVPGHYTLEVSSPGLERSLRVPAHFQREVGKTVSIRLRDTGNADRRIQGVLTAATDTECTLLLDKPGSDGLTERVVPYGQIDRAKTVFVWESQPKTPAPKTPTAKKSAATTSAPKPASKKPSAKGVTR
jgi:ribosome maturation factor RimP